MRAFRALHFAKGRSHALPLLAKRYSTKPMMQELFKAVAKHWRSEYHGSENCAKYFADRGGGLVSSGIEGRYSADGILGCLMFTMRAESPRASSAP